MFGKNNNSRNIFEENVNLEQTSKSKILFRLNKILQNVGYKMSIFATICDRKYSIVTQKQCAFLVKIVYEN